MFIRSVRKTNEDYYLYILAGTTKFYLYPILAGFCYNPTNSFTILEPQDQEIGEFFVVWERRATDFDAPKL